MSRSLETVLIETVEGQAQYDWVIFASHADDSLNLIKDASELERQILSQFGYQDNRMVVHRDLSIMPKSRAVGKLACTCNTKISTSKR